jgi:hypothetical protein
MDRIVRRRLEMAERVRDFSKAHPSTDATYAPVLARLEERIGRLEVVARQQQGGLLTTHASVVRRQELRRRLHHELLRHLVTVAAAAAEEQPGMAELFRLPSHSANNETFRTIARELLEKGQAQRELLANHGLADKLLEDLAAAVNEFDGSVVVSNEGRRDHVGASAELRAVSDDVVHLVAVLDGLNRYRFSGNAELRAAWESARSVTKGPRPPEIESAVKPAA